VAPTPKSLPPPSKETFSSGGNILTPWVVRDCSMEARGPYAKFSTRNTCPDLRSLADSASAERVALYSQTGEVKLFFDLLNGRQDYYEQVPELIAFANLFGPKLGLGPALRIVAESSHWYEVVQNEDTGETAFAPKGTVGPKHIGMWTQTTFDDWLRLKNPIYVSFDHPPLLEEPGGEPVSASHPNEFDYVWYIKLDKPDGEWMYVEQMPWGSKIKGWIKWRDGRKFFFSTPLTSYLDK